MAIMVPEIIGEKTVSKAERRLFNRFRRELPDHCYILHSLGLKNHAHKIWGECDYVILNPDGIFVIEVKGGGVACENGVWTFTDGYGNRNTRAEGPWQQAMGAMYAVRDIVERREDLKGFLYGFGVIMPDQEFTQDGPEIDLNVLQPASRYSQSQEYYMDHLSRYWYEKVRERHGRTPRRLGISEMEAVRQLLRPDTRAAMTLNSTLARVENEQVELTEEQLRTVRGLDLNPRTIIGGGAGTGKTILAFDKARRSAEEGLNVLLLCYNRLLGEHLRETARKVDSFGRLEVWSIHSWFHHVIDKAGMKRPVRSEEQTEDDFYTETWTSAFMDAILQLDEKPFDVLILDEGQDLMRCQYLEALDLVLEGGWARGSWHIFYDPLQNIYYNELESCLKDLIQHAPAQYPLRMNCRNTLQIATAVATFSGIDAPLEGAAEGGRRDEIIYRERDQCIKELGKRIQQLLSEGVRRSEMVILSHRRLQSSILAGIDDLAGRSINDLNTTRSSCRSSIDFCTMHSFKGLERRAVFIVDLHHLPDEEVRFLNYCGMSRARSYLASFIPAEQEKAYRELSTQFGRRLAESVKSQV